MMDERHHRCISKDMVSGETIAIDAQFLEELLSHYCLHYFLDFDYLSTMTQVLELIKLYINDCQQIFQSIFHIKSMFDHSNGILSEKQNKILANNNLNKRFYKYIMQSESSLDEMQPEGQLFVSQQSKYILIKAVELNNFIIPPIYILYQNDEITMKELAKKYQDKINAEISTILEKQITLQLENVGIINPEMTIAMLKIELNNQNITNLEFKPNFCSINRQKILVDQLPYRKSKYFQSIQKIAICFKIPQFNLNVYAKLSLNKSIQEETIFKVLLYLLKTKSKLEIIRNHIRLDALAPSDLSLKCLITNQLINLQKSVESELKLKRKLQLRFSCLQNRLSEVVRTIQIVIHKSIKKAEESLTTIATVQSHPEESKSQIFHEQEKEKFELINNCLFSKVNLYKVLGCKIGTILQECGVPNPNSHGISLLGKVLSPNDYIDKILPSVEGVIDGSIQAYLVYDFQFFYRLFKHLPEQLKLFEISHLKAKHHSLVKKYCQNYRERFTGNFLSINQIEYLLLYTSPFVYKQLNKYLRQDLNIFNPNVQKLFGQWQFKLTHLLVKILKKLPNYNGRVYRFSIEPQQFIVGQIVCFKFFISSSTDIEQAKKFCIRAGCCYIIESMSGKSIANYSQYNQEKQVLFLPFSHFQILSIERTEQLTTIRMREIPSAKKINSSLLLWVDDNPKEGAFIFKRIFVQHPFINLQVINLIDNHSLRKWIQKFGCLMFNKKRKVILVTDMYRKIHGQIIAEGKETIRIIRGCLPTINIFVYVNDVRNAQEKIRQTAYEIDNSSLRVGKDPQQVKRFIEQHSLVVNNPQKVENLENEGDCKLI